MKAIVDELKTIDLGDARLNRRAETLLSRFAEDPQAKVDEVKILRPPSRPTSGRTDGQALTPPGLPAWAAWPGEASARLAPA